ncbi:hypothetical protein [Natronomonas marina]|jgi:hypothetical protein|uniref:hypothetical protein n=1 Tax=Natronomonas marina TaxID=2961939 RepID=UPI0020C95681|nr:hypothetical protein [Natronomonas marina]
MDRSSTTRRRFLLAAGAASSAALAGCNDLGDLGEGSSEEIPLGELPEVPDEGESVPVVADAVPVDIERAKLQATATRVTDLLETLPLPLGAREIPNGYVRGRLVDAADEATTYLDEARSATTRLSALQSLRYARTEARFAAEGWAFVEDGRTKAELRERHRETVEDAEAFRSAHEYRGTDPVRAVVVHAHVEANVRRVLADREPSVYEESGDLLTVAEWGEYAESARTHLEDGRYLYERFTDSLSPGAGSLEGTFDSAADSLVTDVRRRRDELPPEGTPDERDLGWELQYRLRSDAESSAKNVGDGDGAASTVVDATGALTDLLAYERVRNRAEDGERFGAETGADVREARSTALETIRAALTEAERPALARGVLADAAVQVTFADEELARIRRSVRPRRLDDPMRRYVTATVRARSVPEATRQVVAALES